MKIITLPNSLRIFLNKEPHLRSASVGVWVAAGSRYEDDPINGISHFIEHIVFKGSRKRTGFEISEGMDEIGAGVNAFTTKEYTCFYAKALDYQLTTAADILFDMVRYPRLDESDIETEKGVVIEEIGMCEDDPEDVVFELGESSVFSGCGLSRQILGSRDTVKALTKSDLTDYMKKFYVPERMVIGVSGSFDEDEIITKIKEYFSDLGDTGFPVEKSEAPFTKGINLKKMPTEQTHILLSLPGIGIDEEDRFPLQMCIFILGTGTSSMLHQSIRERLGLVYSIDSWAGKYLGGGYIGVTMSLSPSSQEKALRETMDILLNFGGRVTDRQIAVAKEKLIASLIMSREKPQSRFSSTGYGLLLTGKITQDDDIINGIRSVTTEDVRRTAEKFFRLDNLALTVVGKPLKKTQYLNIIHDA